MLVGAICPPLAPPVWHALAFRYAPRPEAIAWCDKKVSNVGLSVGLLAETRWPRSDGGVGERGRGASTRVVQPGICVGGIPSRAVRRASIIDLPGQPAAAGVPPAWADPLGAANSAGVGLPRRSVPARAQAQARVSPRCRTQRPARDGRRSRTRTRDPHPCRTGGGSDRRGFSLVSSPVIRPGAGRETGQDPGICGMTAAHGRHTERKPPLARPLLSVLR